MENFVDLIIFSEVFVRVISQTAVADLNILQSFLSNFAVADRLKSVSSKESILNEDSCSARRKKLKMKIECFINDSEPVFVKNSPCMAIGS